VPSIVIVRVVRAGLVSVLYHLKITFPTFFCTHIVGAFDVGVYWLHFVTGYITFRDLVRSSGLWHKLLQSP